MAVNKVNKGGNRKCPVCQNAKSSHAGADLPLKRHATVERPKSGNPYRTDFDRAAEDRFQAVLQRVRSMTAKEFRESLQAVGIIDKFGKLTKPYRS